MNLQKNVTPLTTAQLATRAAVSNRLKIASDPGGNGKVLLVDNMPGMLENTTMIVEALGFETEDASSVAQDLDLLMLSLELRRPSML